MTHDGIKTKIVLSTSFNPWHNLALEEHLFRQVEKNQVILYLWQNQNTVVIGRHQNAWKECRCNQLEQDGGKLARRLSGGGAVFHDLGNLNFTFIMDRAQYDLQKQLKVILEALKKLNIKAEFSGRNDITVEGRKFSGNAFYFEHDKAYHHGTILINVDIQKLSAYLQVSKEKIASKGVDSVQARVGNLSAFLPDISIESMKVALIQSFEELYGTNSSDPVSVGEASYDLEELYQKYSSWEWLYGKTPSFDIVMEKRFPWGGIELGLSLKNGFIKEAKVYSDAMNSHLIDQITFVVCDLPFDIEQMVSTISKVECSFDDKVIINDLAAWLLSKAGDI
ncbi:lipoate--protein ligase [Desulfosporosinus sp. Sb-LF]|uniref:lipoate--protein ligase n=1 Tax=Desulfosporosinus sp. Sb-LF TaxID=2560027 RepID=UPI00107F1CD2|nr:lipoate--protein ligase [Desulfosporosinus sp. Sb-LF]TGE31609.1 lipoate--protein ligase [Desulfosporosinus sp. Sb-LF]